MQKRIVRKDEQIKLIMECRQSGLSDYQWCQRQGINAGTFYNGVRKLRKKRSILLGIPIVNPKVLRLFRMSLKWIYTNI